MPPEFRILQYKPRDWQPTDTIIIGKILADGLSSTWQNDLLRASLAALPKDKFEDLNNNVTPHDVVLFGKDAPGKPAGNATARTPDLGDREALAAFMEREEQVRRDSLSRVGFYAEELAASNNWVISGNRTADGKPILANDPHLPATVPGIWYLAHLSTPGNRVSGVTLPGVPGIVLGHNAFIAWGATNVGPDVQDVYIETFNEEGKYKTPAGWESPTVRKEEIKVRKNPLSTETETVTIDVLETRNGVIVREDGAKRYALKWTARDPRNLDFGAFFATNRARDWKGFLSALSNYGGPTQNFVYADIKGNIGWYAAGRIPLRRVGDGSAPYDGTTTDGDWTGYIPFEELPNMYNPKEGLIVTANQRIVGSTYKYASIISRDAALPWRARRIYDSLRDNRKVTMDAVRDVQLDNLNMPVMMLAGEILKIGGASPGTIDTLKGWDGRMTPDSRAALLANEVRGCMANKMAEANKPVPGYLVRERVLYWAVKDRSARWLPSQFADYPAFIGACDGEARVALGKRYGADETKWIWGAYWKSTFAHPIASTPFIGAQFAVPSSPLSGSGQTPNVGSSVSMRHIASPGNWDATRHVIPMGESGNPASPHYKDQFELWRTGAPAIFPFTAAAVEKAAKEVWILEPR
jgi:penicillin amidase